MPAADSWEGFATAAQGMIDSAPERVRDNGFSHATGNAASSLEKPLQTLLLSTHTCRYAWYLSTVRELARCRCAAWWELALAQVLELAQFCEQQTQLLYAVGRRWGRHGWQRLQHRRARTPISLARLQLPEAASARLHAWPQVLLRENSARQRRQTA